MATENITLAATTLADSSVEKQDSLQAEELYEVLTEEKEQMEIEKEKKLSLLKENLRKENLL